MQMLAYPHYDKRILYYWARLHQQQLHEGRDYVELRPTISISFLDHVLFPDVPEYHLRFRLLEETAGFPFAEDIELHILELPKFAKSAAELITDLDIWLYFLRHAEKMETGALPVALKQPLVVRALEELHMLTQDEVERERYEARRKAQLDHNTLVRVAREEGWEKGHKEGHKEGKIDVIRSCERLLNRPESPTDQLMALSLDELTRLTTELLAQLQKQR
jgi:predicted transposase/invertase (TIGR01784 family)